MSKLVFVAGEERHGRGSATQHQEPQTRPLSEGTECTQTANHTLWLGEAPGVGWGAVTLHCLRALCLATGLRCHSIWTMGCPKGGRTELKDLLPKDLQDPGSL